MQMSGSWKLLSACLLTSGAIACLIDAVPAQNRPVADRTLENDNSIVTAVRNDESRDRITGGLQRGDNLLLHSFRQFNIDEGRSAYFDNSNGVRNILACVTEDGASTINGTLGVSGGFNLFLLNRDDIVFGRNARLDIRGSFVASSADSILLSSGEVFSTNSQAPLPLRISVLVGLQYGAQLSCQKK